MEHVDKARRRKREPNSSALNVHPAKDSIPFPIPSKRSGCRPYLATLHTLPEIGSWEQCLVTEEDLRIISQAGFRLAAPLWNQIQASGRSSMFARFRIEKMEDWRWRTRYHGWDDRVNGTDTIAREKSVDRKGEKRAARWWNEARKVRTERISSFREVLRLAISWLLILGWVSFYRR